MLALDRQLKAGYVNKERQTQLMQKQHEIATTRQLEMTTAREEAEALEALKEQGKHCLSTLLGAGVGLMVALL